MSNRPPTQFDQVVTRAASYQERPYDAARGNAAREKMTASRARRLGRAGLAGIAATAIAIYTPAVSREATHAFNELTSGPTVTDTRNLQAVPAEQTILAAKKAGADALQTGVAPPEGEPGSH